MKPTQQAPDQPTPPHNDDQSEALRALLINMADLLHHNEPADPITEADRLRLCHELTHGDEPLYSQLRARSAESYRASTRGQYAGRLRTKAGVR
ncbi:MAG: hypothetical protein HOY75_13320 [Streptomyces sp.]|nr:hypothetical protein [Streptomyces sp.]